MSFVALGIVLGFCAWFFVRYVLGGFYTVAQNERAVKTRFGRAARLGEQTTLNDPVSDHWRFRDGGNPVYRVAQTV